MTKVLIGDACAYIGPKKYQKIGVAFRDEQGRICVKIDVLPLPNSGWEGWINVFEKKDKLATSARPEGIHDDDIPF